MSMKLTVLASLLLTACATDVADDVADDDAEVTSASFTPFQARLAGEALAAGIEGTARRFGPADEGAGGNPSCVTSSGDDSDPDGDYIPTDVTLTFDCMKRRFGYTGRLAGTETVVDREPNALDWAFSAVTDLHASLTGPFGGSVVLTGRAGRAYAGALRLP